MQNILGKAMMLRLFYINFLIYAWHAEHIKCVFYAFLPRDSTRDAVNDAARTKHGMWWFLTTFFRVINWYLSIFLFDSSNAKLKYSIIISQFDGLSHKMSHPTAFESYIVFYDDFIIQSEYLVNIGHSICSDQFKKNWVCVCARAIGSANVDSGLKSKSYDRYFALWSICHILICLAGCLYECRDNSQFKFIATNQTEPIRRSIYTMKTITKQFVIV